MGRKLQVAARGYKRDGKPGFHPVELCLATHAETWPEVAHATSGNGPSLRIPRSQKLASAFGCQAEARDPTATDSWRWEWTTVPHHWPVLDLLAGLRNHARPRCPDRGGPFLTHRYADHAWSLSRPWRRLKERWSFPIFVGLRVVDPDTSGIESNFEGASSWFVRAVIGNQPTIANARTIRRIRVPFTISSPGSTSSAPDRPPISLFAALHSHGRPVLQPA
jgi:hypothetical protein